jgi:hypothetical protein
MPYTPRALYRGRPGTTEGTVYTVPADRTALVKAVTVTNTTAAPAVVSVGAGGQPLVDDVSVAADAVLVVEAGVLDVLAAGQTITARQGTADALAVRVTGVEF